MGVSGSGKSTVGARLAAELGWSFRDADGFHSPANIAKMAAGVPLDDADREPWLDAIRTFIDGCLERGEPAVVTCSALRERYRRKLLADPDRVKLVFLRGEYSLILARIRSRSGHYMKDTLLRSQFDTLETPADAFTVDAAERPEEIVRRIRERFGV